MMDDSKNLETITLGGGCFWCLEPVFKDLEGVHDVTVGYAGGSLPNPDYRTVCTGTTGHAEVVQIQFDPDMISLNDIFEVFFSVHDPTTLNRQGADVGTQYRSIILYHNQEQKTAALEYIRELENSGTWNSKIVTQVEPLDTYYIAEDYHQEYYEKNPLAGYCMLVIRPKVSKFRKKYQARLKTT
jgi:methionine-S-sulfoxide reductase